MRFYKDDRTCNNDPVNQKVNWAKLGMQMLDNYKEVQLYNVQFSIYYKNTYHLINKFVYASNADDAKKIVTKRYLDYDVDTTNVYCQKVDIRRGLMFSYNRGDL